MHTVVYRRIEIRSSENVTIRIPKLQFVFFYDIELQALKHGI